MFGGIFSAFVLKKKNLASWMRMPDSRCLATTDSWLYSFFFELFDLDSKILEMYKKSQVYGPGPINTINSHLAYELKITDVEPIGPFTPEYASIS